ncbi:MAG: hypothetical protein JO199_02535 [Candidatus Eremiobacteraeota bacterium]|nr:hypothetical protein [Candidatus Eremiobacteraeota bacterium]
MNQTLSLFLKLTAVIAVGLVIIVLSGMLLKLVIVAGVIAGLILGGFFLYSYLRRRNSLPVGR